MRNQHSSAATTVGLDTAAIELRENDCSRVGELTGWIERAKEGDSEAPEVFYRLTMNRMLAASTAIRRGWNPSGVGTDTLAQEGLLRMAQIELGSFKNSQHFFRVASKVLRRTFIDLNRRATRAKRSAGCSLSVEPERLADSRSIDIEQALVLAEALEALRQAHPDLYRVYLLHWVYGQSLKQVAICLGVAERTARRYWRTTRCLLALQVGAA